MISDEKLREIGDHLNEYIYDQDRLRRSFVDIGRKAYELIRPLVLEEALSEPTRDELDKFRTYGPLTAISTLLRERKDALTAKPDPAVKAVHKILIETRDTTEANRQYADYHAAEIVAAVDKARERKP